MEHDDTDTVNSQPETDTNSQTERADTESLSSFFTAPSKMPMESETLSETSTLPPLTETPPKPGQRYWLSAEAKKKKSEYMRGYNAKKKNELALLRQKQIHSRELTLLNFNGKVITRELITEDDYIKLTEDLLGTLVDNKILKDFQLITC